MQVYLVCEWIFCRSTLTFPSKCIFWGEKNKLGKIIIQENAMLFYILDVDLL